MAQDWLPGRREEQLALAKRWMDLIAPNQAAWKIGNDVLEALATAYAVARAALAKAQGADRTASITAECKAAFEDLVRIMRDTKKRYFFEPPLTPANMAGLGLHPKDGTSTTIPVPSAQPEADYGFPGIHLVELSHIRPVGAPPDGRADHGVRIYWGFMGEGAPHDKFRLATPPTAGSDLPHSLFTRRKKERFDFEHDRGKTVYFALRYENSKGEAGPFGPITEIIVP